MIDETNLKKGQLRTLNALRKSLGRTIADEAFSKWLDQAVEAPEADANAEVIRDAFLQPPTFAAASCVNNAQGLAVYPPD